MKRTLCAVGLIAAISLRLGGSPEAQSRPSAYLTPPKVVADLMDAEPLPGVALSPNRAVMLVTHRKSMPSIADVAAPFYGLGGARIDPRTNHVVQIFTGAGGGAIAVGQGSVWVATAPTAVSRLDPQRIVATRQE